MDHVSAQVIEKSEYQISEQIRKFNVKIRNFFCFGNFYFENSCLFRISNFGLQI